MWCFRYIEIVSQKNGYLAGLLQSFDKIKSKILQTEAKK